MPVEEVTDLADFNAKLAAAGEKVIIVDFHATWCGPCKMIAPFLEACSANGDYANIVFLKVDVDEVEEVALQLKVEAMPTFKFMKNGKEIDEVVGADKDKLKGKLDQYK